MSRITQRLCLFVALGLFAGYAAGDDLPKKEPAKAGHALVRGIDLSGYTPEAADGNPTKPTRITTADELAKAIPNKGVRDRIAKEFDFDKEELLFFAWTGSNTDRLSVQVEQTDAGPMAVFSFVKGQGEDFPHSRCRLFVIAKNWRVVEPR
jgi:hypothetical protein